MGPEVPPPALRATSPNVAALLGEETLSSSERSEHFSPQ